MARVQESSNPEPALAFPVHALPDNLGSTIAKAREKRRWSQARLASKAKVARATVYRIEAGDHPVRPDTVFRLAHALGLEMQHLVPGWPEWDPIGGSGHGPRTRQRRRSLGMTLATLADKVGVSEATLSRFERGVGHSPDFIRFVGDEPYACNEALVDALGFRTLGQFEEYCRTGVAPARVATDADPAGPATGPPAGPR